jgi:hypothetical protein
LTQNLACRLEKSSMRIRNHQESGTQLGCSRSYITELTKATQGKGERQPGSTEDEGFALVICQQGNSSKAEAGLQFGLQHVDQKRLSTLGTIPRTKVRIWLFLYDFPFTFAGQSSSLKAQPAVHVHKSTLSLVRAHQKIMVIW